MAFLGEYYWKRIICLLKLYSGYACLKNIRKGVAIYLEMSYNTFSA